MQTRDLAGSVESVQSEFDGAHLQPLIATATPTVIATVPVNSEAVGIGVNPATDRAYVATYDINVSVIDGLTNTVFATVPVGSRSIGVGVNPSSNRVYVTNPETNTVSVIDGASNTVVATVPVGVNPMGIGVNSITNRVYVANSSSNSVSVIDGASNSVVASLSVGQIPYGVGVNATTNRVYVSSEGDHTVSVIADGPPSAYVVASEGSPSSPNTQFSPEPVNVVFGNYVYQHQDLAVPSRGLSTMLTRSYNSGAASSNGPFGFG